MNVCVRQRTFGQGVQVLKKKVIVAGHICVDITPVFPDKKVSRLDEILTPGKLLNVNEADVHTGGAVANTGLGMHILGADVSLMGKVGNDSFGEIIRNILEKYGAKTKLLVSDSDSTSYSVILAVPGIDRIFLHNCGSNDTFCADDIPAEELKEAALFHFGYPPLMRSMYENDGEELIKVMKLAQDCGAATSLDFASIDPDSKAGAVNWKLVLKKVMPYVDFFVPSVEELCYMLDKERFAQWKERAAGGDITEILDVETDIRPLAEQCIAMGAKVVLIKCGAPGMYYRTSSREVLEKISSRAELDCEKWADKEGFEKSYVPDKILSGTGAGDTSIAAFLTAMLDGYSLEDTMHLAAATGASCVAAYDALSGLKTFDQLQEKIAAGWKKNEF